MAVSMNLVAENDDFLGSRFLSCCGRFTIQGLYLQENGGGYGEERAAGGSERRVERREREESGGRRGWED